jgi:ADP-heptose:LPS heptosyltransferase
MCAATGAPRKIGFVNAREGAARFYSECVPVPDADRIHAMDRYWRIAEHLGAGSGPKSFHLPIAAAETNAIESLLKGLPRPWLAVAVGAKWVTKRWPPDAFAALLSKAQRSFGGSAIFVGTTEDRADSLRAAWPLPGPWRDLTGATTLPRLAALLAKCDAMLANDTGPLHLAAALGVPCVAPYTCTKAALHGPYGQTGGVETGVACGGSYLKHCPHGMICLDDLTPARLWPSLEGVLSRWRLRRSA